MNIEKQKKMNWLIFNNTISTNIFKYVSKFLSLKIHSDEYIF